MPATEPYDNPPTASIVRPPKFDELSQAVIHVAQAALLLERRRRRGVRLYSSQLASIAEGLRQLVPLLERFSRRASDFEAPANE